MNGIHSWGALYVNPRTGKGIDSTGMRSLLLFAKIEFPQHYALSVHLLDVVDIFQRRQGFDNLAVGLILFQLRRLDRDGDGIDA